MTDRNLRLTDKDLRDWLFATNLTPIERHTLLTLAHGIMRTDLTMRLHYTTIARWLGIEIRTAKYRVKHLEELGILIPTRTGGGRDIHGYGYSNEWRFDFEALKALSELDEQTKSTPPKGDTDCTLKDAKHEQSRVQSADTKGDTEQQEGCNPTTRRVIQVAHNPMVPMEPMGTNEDTNEPCFDDESLASFESWWMTYPSRPRCPKGNKSKALEYWQKLTIEERADVCRATTNLRQSNAYPKDAQRFLRPERGGKKTEPVYKAWVRVDSSKVKSSGTESAKHDEDDSWIAGGTR